MWVGNHDERLPLEISLYERGRINHVYTEGRRGEGEMEREGEIYLVIFAILLVVVSEVTLVMVDSLSLL